MDMIPLRHYLFERVEALIPSFLIQHVPEQQESSEMEIKYTTATLPEPFSLVHTNYRCLDCSHEFDWLWSEDGALVKFQEVDGTEERWLATYGRGGYLELLQQLIPGFNQRNTITAKIAEQFDAAFIGLQKPSHNGHFYVVDRGVVCPRCKSKNLRVLLEKIVNNPPLDWVLYRDGILDG
jgi:DNA-directed RNA polymerase subunit RPC12/RpoP